MMTICGPHLSFNATVTPEMGPSAPMGGTAHPVCGTRWVPALLWVRPPGQSQRSYGWDPSLVCGPGGSSTPMGGTV